MYTLCHDKTGTQPHFIQHIFNYNTFKEKLKQFEYLSRISNHFHGWNTPHTSLFLSDFPLCRIQNPFSLCLLKQTSRKFYWLYTTPINSDMMTQSVAHKESYRFQKLIWPPPTTVLFTEIQRELLSLTWPHFNNLNTHILLQKRTYTKSLFSTWVNIPYHTTGHKWLAYFSSTWSNDGIA